jgi:hypothetical protein
VAELMIHVTSLEVLISCITAFVVVVIVIAAT